MATGGSVVEQLKAEGILTPDAELTPEDETILNSLTPEEVASIISIRNKLGTEFFHRHSVIRADFIF